MPVAYSYDTRIVVMRGEGIYSPADLKAKILEALDDPACPREAVLLFDLRESVSLGQRTAEEVRDMARFLTQHSSRFGKRLGVVTSSDVGYGLMRLGSAHVEFGGVTPAVFREFSEARAWLLA
jgi:hypothetical protein